MFFGILRYPLQSINQFAIQSDPQDTLGFVITFVILIVLIVFLNVSKRIRNSVIFAGRGLEVKTRTGPKVAGAFYNKIKYMNLGRKEAAVLERILKSDGGNPYANLLNPVKMDENFRLAYKRILREKRADDIQTSLLELFAIRNVVELAISTGKNTKEKNIVRDFRRKNTNIGCKIYLVTMKNTKGQKKLVLRPDITYQGNIHNISQGGCAIMAAAVLKINSLVKIDFNIGRQAGAALGQIIRINKEANRFIYHIKFLKLSKQTIVDINIFIFDYS